MCERVDECEVVRVGGGGGSGRGTKSGKVEIWGRGRTAIGQSKTHRYTSECRTQH
jgi:hypothetical protein